MMWQKGQSGNPKGRPKGSKNKMTLALQAAIKQVEKERGKNLFKHFVERGYESDKVLTALIRKLIADKTEVEGILLGDITFKLIGVDLSKYPKKKKE